jgi:hypothetical protein
MHYRRMDWLGAPLRARSHHVVEIHCEPSPTSHFECLRIQCVTGATIPLLVERGLIRKRRRGNSNPTVPRSCDLSQRLQAFCALRIVNHVGGLLHESAT